MKNMFAEDWKMGQEIRAAYNNANSEEERQVAMQAMQDFRACIAAKGKKYNLFYGLYADAQERENDCIDFNEIIWEKDVPDFIASLKEYGIKKFSYSSTCTGVANIAWVFLQNGCNMDGMAEINGHKDITDTFTKIPAFMFSIA